MSLEVSCMPMDGNEASGGDDSAVHTGFKLKCCEPETFRYLKENDGRGERREEKGLNRYIHLFNEPSSDLTSKNQL